MSGWIWGLLELESGKNLREIVLVRYTAGGGKGSDAEIRTGRKEEDWEG